MIAPSVFANQTDTLDYYVVEGLTAPFQITDPDAKQKGFITDVVEALALELDIELVTHVAPSPRIEMLLKDEKRTNWIAYGSPAWNSLPNGVYLTTPLLKVTHSAVHCGHGHSFNNKLSGHNFAILKHFRYPGLSNLAREGRIELTPVKSYEQGFSLVDLGRVDGFIEMNTRLKYNLATSTSEVKCREISSIGDIEPQYDLVLVVSKHMAKEKRKQLNKALQNLYDSGFFEKTLLKYTK